MNSEDTLRLYRFNAWKVTNLSLLACTAHSSTELLLGGSLEVIVHAAAWHQIVLVSSSFFVFSFVEQ